MSTTPNTTTELWGAIIQPIIDWCGEVPGRKATLVAAFQSVEPTTRQNIEQWLHNEPAKRVHPRTGAGLLLALEAEKLGVSIPWPFNPKPQPTTKRKTR